MKAYQTKPRKAFTLIELLVVIAIIALLLSIIVPSLNKAKIAAQKTICAKNIGSQALGVRLYAEQNDSVVPYNVGGNWFWDMSFYSTNQIRQLADIDHPSFFCPVNKLKKSDDARFWQYSWVDQGDGPKSSGNRPIPLADESRLDVARQKVLFRVMSYVYMFERLNTSGASMYDPLPDTQFLTKPKPVWIKKMSDLRNASSTVMIADS
nr:prepilin-type N-terminal cleavage/methylation domain-containing protein [Anaerohalosphaeraceae bacterium]